MNDIGRQLDDVIVLARAIQRALGATLATAGDRVHFRPTSTGVTMVGLLHDTAQRGRAFRNVDALAANFEFEFARCCRDITQGRATPEKQLQSFLIREAWAHQRLPLSSSTTLLFVTDELALVTDQGRVVCDLLALRVEGDVCVPVIVELKSARQLTRLVEQVDAYAALVDAEAVRFATLFSVMLDRAVTFTGGCEKWIVWPQAGAQSDPRASSLAAANIVVVGYEHVEGGYRFRVG